MSKIEVSYIIPYRKSTEDRERNLKLILKWINHNIDNYEIIIVEMDNETKLDKSILSPKVKHVFQEDRGIFNRALARNIGGTVATKDVLIFSDNDVILDPKLMDLCIQECYENHYDAVNPCFAMVDLKEEDLRKINYNVNDFDYFYKMIGEKRSKDVECYREDMNFAAAIFLIRKDMFKYIGGWPDEFVGWGGEDDVMSYKIESLLNSKGFNECIYHLPHQRNAYDWCDHPEYQNNCDKMNRILNFDIEQLKSYCEEGRNKLLNINI